MPALPVLPLNASQKAFEDPARAKPSSLPVPHPTPSLWINSIGANPLAAEGSKGVFIADADVCILGSGITGVSAAYHLSIAVERGDIARPTGNPLRVVILEARDFCSGATGRNGGHLTPLVFLEFCAFQSRYGIDQAVRALELENHNAAEMAQLIRSEGWTGDVDLVENGHTTLFFTPSEFASATADFEAAKKAGMDLSGVQWLTKEETQDKYGSAYPAVELGGFNLWPLKFVTKLYQFTKAKAANFELNLHTRTPATSISPSSSPSRRWAVRTHRGILNCSYVIHATNAYASHLLPHMAGPAGIVPTRGQVVALRASVPADELKFKCSWDGNQGFEYWFPRPLRAGRESEKPLIILGGGREDDPDFEFYQADDSALNPVVGMSLRKFLPNVFPGKFAKDKEPEQEWTGIMAFTKLHDPFVGPVVNESDSNRGQFEGQYISAGYSGHGMPRAFSCAAVVAGMVASDISGSPWEIPGWFPEAFLTNERIQ
ncbi:FAD dependent oxidoreductase [Mycena filopes]|nr:FAD dependent oxidoreductase [Mycena filopes]